MRDQDQRGSGKLEEAIVEFYSIIEGGGRPVREDFASRFPEITADIDDLFANLEALGAGRSGTGGTAAIAAAGLAPGHAFGDYFIQGELARGGMGVVYRALQRSLARPVALKVILAGRLASDAERSRFRREAMAAAALDHPNIVPVFDAGEHEGLPFISMKLIEGKSLADLEPPAPERARWAAGIAEKVARAVAHAHGRGVIHRDLKPGNVIVGADGEPHVTDFGLARISEGGGETQSGAVLGTIPYMPPEQARGDAARLDSRVDVYGIGAVLHQLLAGVPPFRGSSPVDLLRRIAEDEVDPRALRSAGLPRDLVTVCLRCLERDPARRYATATELADDLRRFLDGRPILARPPSAADRLGKWAQRHRRVVLAAATTSLLVVVGLAASTFLITRAYRDESEAHSSALYHLYLSDMHVARSDWETGQVRRMAELLERHIPGPSEPDPRGWEWYHLLSLAHEEEAWLQGHREEVKTVCWSPDGFLLASGSWGEVILWGGSPMRQISAFRDTLYNGCIAWSPDGRTIAVALRAPAVKLIDVASGAWKGTIRWGGGECSRIAWSPGGDLLAVAGLPDGRTVSLVDVKTAQAVLACRVNHVQSIAWSPDGRWLASGDVDGYVKALDSRTGSTVLSLKAHPHDVFSIAWSRQGDRLASGSYRQQIRAWEFPSGKLLLDLPCDGGAEAVTWSPDGTRIAAGTRALSVTVWDAASGREVRKLQGHLGWVRSVSWSPDGARLASAGESVRVWDVRRPDAPPALETQRIEWSPRGDRLACSGGDRLRIMSPDGRQEAGTAPEGPNDPIAWSPDGKLLATRALEAPSIRIWDPEAGRDVTDRHGAIGERNPFRPAPLSWRPDGTELAAAIGKEVWIRDVASGKLVATLRGHEDWVWSVRWSPDGGLLASSAWDGTVKVWDRAAGSCRTTFRGHAPGHWISGLGWSPDGTRIASGGWDQLVKVWEVATGREVFSLRGHTEKVWTCEWSPDGRRLATAGSGFLKIWDPDTGEEVLSLPGFESCAWSPDGWRIAGSTIAFASLKVLDASRGQKVVSGPEYRRELAWMHHEEALSLARSRRFDESDGEIRRSIEHDRTYVPPWLTRAWIYLRLGEERRARDDFRRALDAEPGWTTAKRDLARLLAVSADLSLRDPPAARALAEEGAAEDPGAWWSWYVLGRAYLAGGRAGEALEAFRRALRRPGPADLPAVGIALSLGRLGRREEAIRWLGRGRTPAPGDLGEGVFAGEAGAFLGRGEARTDVAVIEDMPRPEASELDRLAAARKELLPDLVTFASIDSALGEPDRETLVEGGSRWRCFRGPGEPPPGWTGPGFADDGWTDFDFGKDALGAGWFRCAFEVPDPARFAGIDVRLCAYAAWTAWIDGQQVGRRGEPDEPDRSPSPADGPATCFTVDPATLAPGRHVLALRSSAASKSRFDLTALVRVEGRLPLRPPPAPAASTAGRGARLLDDLKGAARGDGAPARIAYLEGRLLQAAGEARAALARFEECRASAPARHEPWLRAAACLRALGRPAEAEERAREGLRRNPQAGREAWDEWLSVCFADLRLPPSEVLARFPVPDEEDPEGGARRPSIDLWGYGADVRWLLDRLAAGEPVGINCGGMAYRDPSGTWWGEDRFAIEGGGEEFARDPVEIGGTDADHLHHSGREFRGAPARDDADRIPAVPGDPGDRGDPARPRLALLRGRQGYRIPCPPGRRTVTLLFAETRADAGDDEFDVRIEGRSALERFRPAAAGLAVAQARSFDIDVEDGFVDIEFLARSGDPRVDAIQVR